MSSEASIILTIIEYLSRFLTSGESPLAVLMLLGSSGVGKSFIADIIRDNFPLQVKIFW